MLVILTISRRKIRELLWYVKCSLGCLNSLFQGNRRFSRAAIKFPGVKDKHNVKTVHHATICLKNFFPLPFHSPKPPVSIILMYYSLNQMTWQKEKSSLNFLDMFFYGLRKLKLKKVLHFRSTFFSSISLSISYLKIS